MGTDLEGEASSYNNSDDYDMDSDISVSCIDKKLQHLDLGHFREDFEGRGPGPVSDGAKATTDPMMMAENWICCDNCQKWRLLPLGTNPDNLPEKWFCSLLNWLPGMNQCSVSEEETTKALYQVQGQVYQNNLQIMMDEKLQHFQEEFEGGVSAENLGMPRQDGIMVPCEPGLVSNAAQATAGPVLREENWVCCNKCQKWRLLPLGTNFDNLPDKWLCSMLNWLPGMNRCSVSEEETTEALKALY